MILLPDFNTFTKLSRKGNLVALSTSIPADLETPVSAYLKLADGEPHSFLLESAEQEERIGRYSFIGLRPKKILTANQDQIQLATPGKGKVSFKNQPVTKIIEGEMKPYHLANSQVLPEFAGGFVGYLSYENVRHFETIQLNPKKKGPAVPDSIFFLCQDLVIFDHFRKTISVVIIQNTSPLTLPSPQRERGRVRGNQSLAALYQNAERKIQFYLNRLKKPVPESKRGKTRTLAYRSNVSPEKFRKQVNRIKEYIRAGDCIQVVLSQRFSAAFKEDDFKIYRALRSVNPSPYMFYFRSKQHRLIGSSPEVLVRKSGQTATLRPIAGTRPRGQNHEEDLRLEENLKRSVKETAEHLMLVDLGRNDLGRVCSFDSVKVQNYARVERYSHVMHLVSDVVGKLKAGKSAFDLLAAVFPAGTVSGAPKIRAMQIIDELETEKRGPYAGCLGYFSFNGDMDMCITIRTLVADGKKIYIQAGAGIVQDSNPEKEFEETVNKAKALLKAIEIRNQF